MILRAGLPRRRILRGRYAFDRLFKSGRSFSHGSIRLLVTQRAATAPGIHVGFAVRRSFGSAVRRNRARRVLRAAVASLLPELRVQVAGRGVSLFMVVLYRGKESPRYAAAHQSLARLFQRLV